MKKKTKAKALARGGMKGATQASRTAGKPGVARGRYDFMCVFPGGGSLRVMSDKTRSLSLAELVEGLREWADRFERAERSLG